MHAQQLVHGRLAVFTVARRIVREGDRLGVAHQQTHTLARVVEKATGVGEAMFAQALEQQRDRAIPAQRVTDRLRVRRAAEEEARGVRQQHGVGTELDACMKHELDPAKLRHGFDGGHLLGQVHEEEDALRLDARIWGRVVGLEGRSVFGVVGSVVGW